MKLLCSTKIMLHTLWNELLVDVCRSNDFIVTFKLSMRYDIGNFFFTFHILYNKNVFLDIKQKIS